MPLSGPRFGVSAASWAVAAVLSAKQVSPEGAPEALPSEGEEPLVLAEEGPEDLEMRASRARTDRQGHIGFAYGRALRFH